MQASLLNWIVELSLEVQSFNDIQHPRPNVSNSLSYVGLVNHELLFWNAPGNVEYLCFHDAGFRDVFPQLSILALH